LQTAKRFTLNGGFVHDVLHSNRRKSLVSLFKIFKNAQRASLSVVFVIRHRENQQRRAKSKIRAEILCFGGR